MSFAVMGSRTLRLPMPRTKCNASALAPGVTVMVPFIYERRAPYCSQLRSRPCVLDRASRDASNCDQCTVGLRLDKSSGQGYAGGAHSRRSSPAISSPSGRPPPRSLDVRRDQLAHCRRSVEIRNSATSPCGEPAGCSLLQDPHLRSRTTLSHRHLSFECLEPRPAFLCA